MELVKSIKRAGVSVVGFLALLSMTAGAQETRSEVSVQDTGFFTDLLRGKSDAKMGRHTALKVKRSVILLRFAIVASATLSARRNRESNAQGNTTQLLLAAAEQAAFEQSPTTPDAASREPKEPLQHCVFLSFVSKKNEPGAGGTVSMH
jgi:hypothetical protein